MITIRITEDQAQAAWEAMGVGLRAPDGTRQTSAWKDSVSDVLLALSAALEKKGR